jgi:anti-sigma regulatory factor (Ser/Thr protein kinase)
MNHAVPNKSVPTHWLPANLPAWAIVFLAATGAGVFFSLQIFYSNATFHSAVSWSQAFYWGFGDWYEWALLFPVIVWLCRRFPFNRDQLPVGLAMFLVSALVLATLHAGLCALAALLQGALVGPQVDFKSYLRFLLETRLPFNLAVFLMLVCAWHAWDFHRRYRESGKQLTELSHQLMEAQLFALRMQLNPHFLFNTLNTVSALMLTDVRAANQMLSRLGTLLRETLDGDCQPEVRLERELSTTLRYLEIEQVRFGERLRIKVDAPAEIQDAVVPTFILQPVVENAIHHAIAYCTEGGAIVIRCSREKDLLQLQVADTGTGGDASRREPGSRRRDSVGLGNIRQRLQKLYGSAQRLELQRNDEGGTTVSIALPFRRFASEAT